MKALANYVEGRWVEAAGEEFSSLNPATGEVVATARAGTPADVDGAVSAARRAFDRGDWPRTRAAHRAAALLALADALERREKEAGELIADEMGKPVRVARGREVGGAVDRLRYFAGAARNLEGRFVPAPPDSIWDMEIPEPIGVAALVIPWNDPIDLAVRKLGAALAVGCTTVLKPSEVTPASTSLLVEVIDETGVLPPGVVNLVQGAGRPTGEALVSHPGVNKISFTGSTATGKAIMRLAAENLTKVSLECGGKSAAIVFADTDLERCLDALAYGAFMYSGQSCTACTRLIVEEPVYQQIIEGLSERIASMPMGDPRQESVLVGPMASAAQYRKAVDYLRVGFEEGGTAVIGGEEGSPDDLYLPPTVFAGLPLESRLVQEEIFGPIVTIHPFTEVDEAVRLAGSTRFGLGSSVWSGDLSRALQVARRVDVADMWVNGYYLRHAETSFGGRHLSGIGRELGPLGVEEYVAWKRVCIDTRPGFHLKEWFEGSTGFDG